MRINLEENITDNFKWYEALYLVQWDIYTFPNSRDIRDNIIKTCLKLEELRSLFNVPFFVSSFYRPKHYNRMIGGAKNSWHMQGLACDFIPVGVDVNFAKQKILAENMLEKLDIRMESNTDGWIHIDLGRVIHERYFIASHR